ncbi:ABC transporter substrate-binding protein [Pararhizobium sp. YC-54]|uniref:ABC transporter substrate-binding protein n=1 Tax=Pararhizobium sp. YC-54 TaxID=2986920 RepID=UPI0021F71071|nr:ABC transporter substrate-binding protein [Pararhizobium sp. YC-54]MCV9999766.1 ABC transporter substrate-binding protein [Pararhizobium sp. YC-54]
MYTYSHGKTLLASSWLGFRTSVRAAAFAAVATTSAMAPAFAEVPVDQLVRIVAENGSSFTRVFNPFSPTTRWVSTRTIFEPLMIQNYATGKLDPWLATGYKWSDDALSLEFTLRDGVKWSDGQPFSADDVAFTFTMMRDHPGLIGPATGAFSSYLKSVEAVNPTTVKFTFNSTYTPGLFSIADQFVVPKHVWQGVKDPMTFENAEPVGTGPFTTVDAFGTDRYQMTRNPNYWQPINIEGVFVQGFNGNDQVSAALLAGNIDWGGLVPDPDVTFVPADPDHFGYWWPRTSVVQLQANTTVGALGDTTVRKAMSMALDRQRMINTGVWGKSVPANATGLPEAPFKEWIDPKVVADGQSWVTMDVDAANTLLDDAGYARGADGVRAGKDGTPLKYDIIVPSGWNDWVSASQIVAENLKDVGIDVTLRTMTADSWTNATFSGKFQLSLGTAVRTATPFEFYRNNMATTSVQPVGTASPNNQQRYGDPKVDELLAKFAASTSLAEQKAVVSTLEGMFSAAAPIIPLYEQPDWGLYNTRRFTGFPTADKPYAPLSLQMTNGPLLVWPHLVRNAN